MAPTTLISFSPLHPPTSPPPLPSPPTPHSLSPHQSAQIRARLLRLNLTPSSPSSHLLQFHNSLIHSFTSLSLHSTSLSSFLSLLSLSLSPNHFTFPPLLKSTLHLASLDLGRQIHTHLLKSHNPHNPFCATALLNLYLKLGPLQDALKLFDRMPEKSVPAWNAMILAVVRNGFVEVGLEMLGVMEREGVEVGTSSWNAVLAGCVALGDVELVMRVLREMVLVVRLNGATFNTILPVVGECGRLGWLRELHGFGVRNLGVMGCIDEERFRSAVAAGYVRNGFMDYAVKLLERVELRNSQLGNSMISGFLNCGESDKAFDAFREMAAECIYLARTLSKVSLTLLLPECGRFAKGGLEIHAYAIRRGLESDTSVGNALMAMYSKRGDKKSVERVFERILDKDVISWNTIVASHALSLEFDQAFELFHHMISEGLKPDEYSFSSVLSVCGHSSNFRQAMAFHGNSIKSGYYESYPVVQNSLMDAYGKCGCVTDARKVFDEMEWIDTISWNTIISSYGFSPFPNEAISLFEKMTAQGWKPNRSTFVALLSTCSHSGLLEMGLHYFDSMDKNYGIVPDLDHYVCIVDCMGKMGQIERAYEFIKHMSIEPDDCIWSSLLNSCRIHGNVEMAEISAKNLIKTEPMHSGYWVLLSNVYANVSRWDDKRSVWLAMKDGGVKKSPACSWTEVGGEIHRFVANDRFHKRCDDIYLVLDGLTEQLKDRLTEYSDHQSLQI